MRRVIMILGLMSLMLAGVVNAQDVRTTPPDGRQYQLVEIASGFQRPVFVTGAGDGSGRLFIEDQEGRIWVMIDGQLQAEPFLDVRSLISRDANERGLLGLAFHPQYVENGFFFINYTDRSGNTVVARYTVSADSPSVADADSALTLLNIRQPYPNHNGGYLGFGPDGYLYIGMGDGGSAGDPDYNGQTPSTLLGKILRIDVDNPAGDKAYGIPTDNPYTINPLLAPEVWAWGLRNPWRMSFDRETGDLYFGDVGQNQWEEVNFQPADSPGGENYGWNIMEGSYRYSGEPVKDGLVPPFAEYSHAEGGCSVTGGYVYRGEMLTDLTGVYLFADYCSGLVWSSYRDAADIWQTNLFLDTGMTVSSFGEDEAGELYVIDHSGSIYRLEAV